MKRAILRGLFAVAIFASGIMLFETMAQAANVCYTSSLFAGERFRFSAKSREKLTTTAEENLFGIPVQRVFDVFGKHVFAGSHMATINGTIISATFSGGGVESHLGFFSHLVRSPDGVTETGFPVTVECTTDEVTSSKNFPGTWHCQARNEGGAYHGVFTLTKVDPLSDSLCSVFENGTSLPAP
jgi:hypothetical protein